MDTWGWVAHIGTADAAAFADAAGVTFAAEAFVAAVTAA